jgi:DNA-directed RNA polymerase specialized sigma54-like protein
MRAEESAGPWSLDLSGFQSEVRLIERMGEEAFERYFLYEKGVSSLKEAAARCGITEEQAGRLHRLLDAISLQAEESRRSPQAIPSLAHSVCVARVELVKSEPTLVWTLPHLARGRYEIDYDGVAMFLKSGNFSPNEADPLRRLIRQLERINMRQNTLERLLEIVLRTQSRYLVTGRALDLTVFPKKLAAHAIGVHPSRVGRLVCRRSLLAPWSREIPLADLLPNQREKAVFVLQDILQGAPGKWTDERIRQLLERQYGLRFSRRTVNECRRLAEKSPVSKRRGV